MVCDGCQFEFWVNGEKKQSIIYNEKEATKVEFESVISPTLVNQVRAEIKLTNYDLDEKF